MTTIATDRRRIEAREDPEGERCACEAVAHYLDAKIRTARALRRIDDAGTFHLRGCSSVVEYAVRLGVPAADARMLVDLARVLDVPAAGAAASGDDGSGGAVPQAGVAPSVEDLVRSGRLPVENAALLGKVLDVPGATRPGEDWVRTGEAMPTPVLRRLVNTRLEEAAQGTTKLVAVTLNVTPRARDAFGRARDLASRQAGTRLTEGQTFALVVDRYLDACDELRRGEGARRIGPTEALPGERYVPAAVRRRVLERSEDRCEVPSCTFRTFLEFAHVESHAGGGSREADNLLRLCSVHHTQLDAGLLEFDGWQRGRPSFRAAGSGLDPREVADVDVPPPRDLRGDEPSAASESSDAAEGLASDRGTVPEASLTEPERLSFSRALMAELESRGGAEFDVTDWPGFGETRDSRVESPSGPLRRRVPSRSASTAPG